MSDADHEAMSDALDEDIAQVRAEIENLTKRRKLLASSLPSSTKVQDRLSKFSSNTSTTTHLDNPLISSTRQHNEGNVHRVALGVTSFPFQDPSPELQSRNPLLGIRFDIVNRTGKFDNPYYLFCVRAGDDSRELRIHRHTIPALVPLQEYERTYLPLQDEGYGSEESILGSDGDAVGRKQDLHGLVAKVRRDLVSWRLRQDAIDLVRENLEIPIARNATDSRNENEINENQDSGSDNPSSDVDVGVGVDEPEPVGKHGVTEISALGVDAYQVRIVWSDGRVGRIQISDDAKIAKARVIGLDGGRLAELERVLTEGNATIYELDDKLEKIHRKGLRKEKRVSKVSQRWT